MKLYFKISIILLTVIISNTGNAQTIDEVSKEYLKLYTSTNFDKIGEYYNSESIFEDPTLSFFYNDYSHPILKGKKGIVDFLKEGFAKMSNINYEIEKSYSVGSISFNYGILHYDSLKKNEDGTSKTINHSLPLAIILTIKDGKVIHHQDFADYNVWSKQYNE